MAATRADKSVVLLDDNLVVTRVSLLAVLTGSERVVR